MSKNIFGPNYFGVQNILFPKIFQIQNRIVSKNVLSKTFDDQENFIAKKCLSKNDFFWSKLTELIEFEYWLNATIKLTL